MSEALRDYVDACTHNHVSYVAEFVEALSSGARECVLADRAIPLNDGDAMCIAAALEREHEIRTLDLEGNEIGVNGVRSLIDALSANPCVKELRLGRNKLGDAPVVVLGKAITHVGLGLRVLDLSHNDITLAGCAALLPDKERTGSSAGRDLSDIVELSLYGNRLDDDCGLVLANAIRASSRLKHLHLGYNQLQDRGAIPIALAMPVARGLATIDLSGNRIGPQGGAAFAEALRTPSCLVQRVNLRHNDFDDATLRMFVDVVRNSCVLVQLFLGFMCPADPTIAEALLQAASVNRTLLLLDVLGWEMPAARREESVSALLASPTALRALLIDGCFDIRLKIDDLNERRTTRMGHAVVYVGDDEHAGAAAVNAAQRELRLQAQQHQSGAGTSTSTSRQPSPGATAKSPAPVQRQEERQSHPAPAEPITAAQTAEQPTQAAQPAPASTSAAGCYSISRAIEQLAQVQTADAKLRDAIVAVAEALHAHCCRPDLRDSDLLQMQKRIEKLEESAAAAPKVSPTNEVPPPARTSLAEQAVGFVTVASGGPAQQQPGSAQQQPPPPNQQQQAAPASSASAGGSTTRDATTTQPQQSKVAQATARDATPQQSKVAEAKPAAETKPHNAQTSIPATTRRDAPTKDNSEAAGSGAAASSSSQPTQGSQKPAAAPAGAGASDTSTTVPATPTKERQDTEASRSTAPPRREPAAAPQNPTAQSGPSAQQASPSRERIAIGEQHSPHGPSESLPIPVAVNERSRSPSHVALRTDSDTISEPPRRPALQRAAGREVPLSHGADKAKADLPARPGRAKDASGDGPTAPTLRATSQAAASS